MANNIPGKERPNMFQFKPTALQELDEKVDIRQIQIIDNNHNCISSEYKEATKNCTGQLTFPEEPYFQIMSKGDFGNYRNSKCTSSESQDKETTKISTGHCRFLLEEPNIRIIPTSVDADRFRDLKVLSKYTQPATNKSDLMQCDASKDDKDIPKTKEKFDFEEENGPYKIKINDEKIPVEIRSNLEMLETVKMLREENKVLCAQFEKYYTKYYDLKDKLIFKEPDIKTKLTKKISLLEEELAKLKQQQHSEKLKYSCDWEELFTTLINKRYRYNNDKPENLVAECNLIDKAFDKLGVTCNMQKQVNFWRECFRNNQQSMMTMILKRFKDNYELEQFRTTFGELEDLCDMLEKNCTDATKIRKACLESDLEKTHVDDQKMRLYNNLLELCGLTQLIKNKVIKSTKKLYKESDKELRYAKLNKELEEVYKELHKDLLKAFEEE